MRIGVARRTLLSPRLASATGETPTTEPHYLTLGDILGL